MLPLFPELPLAGTKFPLTQPSRGAFHIPPVQGLQGPGWVTSLGLHDPFCSRWVKHWAGVTITLKSADPGKPSYPTPTLAFTGLTSDNLYTKVPIQCTQQQLCKSSPTCKNTRVLSGDTQVASCRPARERRSLDSNPGTAVFKIQLEIGAVKAAQPHPG